MYAHHVVTLLLVVGSYANGDKRIGALVLLLHDSSDILARSARAMKNKNVTRESSDTTLSAQHNTRPILSGSRA